MRTVCTDADLNRLLSEVAFARNMGFTVAEVGDGQCSLEVRFQESLERPGGLVSGQVFMAAADVAMWLAIKTRLGISDESVTSELKTNFLEAARRSGFRCTARILKLGRRLIFGVAECTDASGRLLTYHTVTYVRRERELATTPHAPMRYEIVRGGRDRHGGSSASQRLRDQAQHTLPAEVRSIG